MKQMVDTKHMTTNLKDLHTKEHITKHILDMVLNFKRGCKDLRGSWAEKTYAGKRTNTKHNIDMDILGGRESIEINIQNTSIQQPSPGYYMQHVEREQLYLCPNFLHPCQESAER